MKHVDRLVSGVLLMVVFTLVSPVIAQPTTRASGQLVYVDSAGVIRWKTTKGEVAQFGANYCLPSAADYRAAGMVHADRKKLIDEDTLHFVRMGWDGMRLCFWGDWENSDKEGNLIANDHLDLLDYLIYAAKKRDLHMLLSPIVTYDSLWPEEKPDASVVGFSRQYKKSELGTKPAAIAAQANYLRQLLNHVNPYTGVALKDEAYILYLELINEPAHHAEDFDGSVKYINTLVEAVRSTGCQKITFFNLSQDFRMTKAIAASKADGVSIAWYPSGLVSGHQQQGNMLPMVDHYAPMMTAAAELAGKAKLVYEFDMPDVMSGYHYPAMARTFREAGAQFAAMFSYDMVATAPYNLSWQTHCLNLVYTPQKAVSAIIASQVMRRIPRGQGFGDYPANTTFGDFHVNYEKNLSELAARDFFEYSNDTTTQPPAPAMLRRIVGFGSSPVVQYEGVGSYFLDKLDAGRWRLEVYPDAIQVDDPFAPVSVNREVFQLVRRWWPMTIRLAELGETFGVMGLNEGNSYRKTAVNGTFEVSQGVYLLTSGNVATATSPQAPPFPLPDHLPRVSYYLGLREFECPAADEAAISVLPHCANEYPNDQAVSVRATIATAVEPAEVYLQVDATGGGDGSTIPMKRVKGYEYEAVIGAGQLTDGRIGFRIGVKRTKGNGPWQDFPADGKYTLNVISVKEPLVLFDAARDASQLALSRSGEQQNRAGALVQGSSGGVNAFQLSMPSGADQQDMTASLYVGDRIAARRAAIAKAREIRIKLRGVTHESVLRLTLVDKRGLAWSVSVKATGEWNEVVAPISQLKPSEWVLLPQAYPGTWSYFYPVQAGATAMDITQIERMQISLRKADLQGIASADAAVEIESVRLQY